MFLFFRIAQTLMFRAIFFIIIINCFVNIVIAQENHRYINIENVKIFIDKWEDKFTRVEITSEKIKLPFYTALSHFPELDNKRIKIRYKSMHATMRCRPSFSSIVKSKKNRQYIVYINTDLSKGMILDSLSFNSQLGIFGHEIAHIYDYKDKTNLGIIILGIKYMFPSKRRIIETRVDNYTISKGLGWQLFDFRYEVENSNENSKRYAKKKTKYYLSSEQIKEKLTNTR